MVIQQIQNHQRNLKVKKRSESSLDKVDPKNMKITLPSSKIDERSLSSMSKNSHETDSIPGENNQGQYLDLQSKLLK